MRKMKTLLLLIITLNFFVCYNNIFATEYDGNAEFEQVISDNVVYKVNNENKTASVVQAKDVNTKKIIIPEKLNGYTITKIEKNAFGSPIFKNWESIILPDTVTELGDRAFNFCPKLKTIKLPHNLEKIGEDCFQLCSSLESLFIPDNVAYIGKDAFFSCVSLKNINMPHNLKVLEKGIFAHCISLQGIYIHENIEKINNDAFRECGSNIDLNSTVIDACNPFYMKVNNAIIDKRDNSEVIKFSISDEIYNKKVEYAKQLYNKMKEFIKKHSDCSLEKFEEECINFLIKNSSSPKLLLKEEFEKLSKNKNILYRGVDRKEYVDDFKSRKMFFSANLLNERGCGIYTTPERIHAEFWIWSKDPKDYEILDQYNYDDELYEKMAYKLVPHGEVIEMFMDESARVLSNSYLREIKDIIFKMRPEKFKYAATLRDATFSNEILKELNIFNSKWERLFHNSGVLTRLLDYDALYERETNLIIDACGTLGSEYLVVNSQVLNVLV